MVGQGGGGATWGGGNLIKVGGGQPDPVRVFADGAELPSPWQRRQIRRGQAAGQGHPY